MRTTLLRGLIFLLFLVGLRAVPAAASHLVGGEMSYKYLDANGPDNAQFRYRVTVLLYINWECTNTNDISNVPDGRCNIFINIYDKQNGTRINSGQAAQGFSCAQVSCPGRPAQNDQQPQGTFRLPRVSNPSITPPLPGGCSLPGGPPPPVRLCRYEAIVNLPVSFGGYYVLYTDGTRNRSINNLAQPDNQNQSIYVDMAPPLLPNSSPTFSDTAVVVICQGDTSIVVNNAVDLDGDRLIYSFSTPYNISGPVGTPAPTFVPPPPSVTYNTGFSATAPFGPGAGNYAFLNASNGLSRYATSQQGRYVVAVEVKEFRKINGNEVLIGSTRREIQLVSRQCQPNQAPQFTAATLANKVFTIEEGETVNFNLAATDPDGNAISLKVNSVLLDGTGPFDASFGGSQGVVQSGNPTGSVTITGTGGLVNGLFSFNSRCGNGRSTLYDIVVTATDQACGAKSVADIFQIRVNRAAGPTSITGDAVICDQSQLRTYTAAGPTAAAYLWRAFGGSIQGPNSGNTVQVRWNTTGAGRLSLRGVSNLGCPSDSVSRDIDIRPASALAVTPTSATICRGNSTTLTASGAASYTWTGGNQTFTGPTITVSPTQTTTYTVTSTDGVCTTSRQVIITVNQVAVANAGDDVATCSGDAKTLGSAALTGYTYQWSPATGLSSATVAQPTFLLTNTGATPQQFTYTLTATTNEGCTATDVVTITLNPAAVANAGSNKTICSGGSATLGGSPDGLAGRTYQWSPATGLDNPTAAFPTVTLTNTGTTPLVVRYTLSVTTNQICTTTAFVDVTVNPAAVANAGTDVATCSGDAKTLGSSALMGYTYQWSPATGLSSTTVAQPTFLLTNTGIAPQQFTYTLTATTTEGCTATDIVVVTLNPAAVAEAGTAKVFCSGGSAVLGNAASAVAGSTYQWSPATGLSSASAVAPTVTLANTGTVPVTTTYTLRVTTAAGCTDTKTVQVTVNPAAVANAGTDVATCSGDAKTLGSSALMGYTYQWSPATGLSSATVAQPTFLLTNTGATPQQFTYTLTATTTEGCTATDIVTVTLNPAAVAEAGTAKVFCSGGSAVLGNAGSAVAGSAYLWTPATGLSNPTAVAPTVTLTNTGSSPFTITYTLRVTTSPGCVATKTVDVTVNPAAVANAGNDVATCSGDAKTLGSSALMGYTYQWSPATGLSSTTVAQPTFLLTNTGIAPQQFTYTLTATTTEGCTATDIVVVTLNPAAVAEAGTAKVFCSGGSAVLGNAASAVAGSTYQWSPATGLSSASAVAPTVTLANTGTVPVTTTYTLRVTTAAGCTDTKTVQVTVNPAAVANAGPGRQLCSKEASVLGVPAVAGYTYRWSPATNLSNPNIAQPVFQLANQSGAVELEYTLTVTNTQGCSATSTVRIGVYPQTVADAGLDAAVCAGKSIRLGTLARGGYGYEWSPAVGLNDPTAAQPLFTAPSTSAPQIFTFVVQALAPWNCPVTDTVRITVNPQAPTDNIQGARSVCPTIQGVVYSIVNPRSTEYRWSVVGGTVVSGNGTASITVNWGAANATASVQAFARNQFGCDSDPVTFPVIINQRLNTETPQGPASVCLANGPYTYSVSPTVGSVYAWQITGGTQISTGPGTVQVQWNGPGTGTVSVTETSNPNGGAITCFGQSQALAVTVRPSPAANLAIAGPDRLCAGGTVSFSLPGAPTSSYTFLLDGTAVTSTGNTATFATPAPGPHILTAQETNSSTCAGPVFSRQFIVDPRPAAVVVAGPASICPTPSGFGTQQYSVLNTPGSTYAWTVTGGTIVSGNGSSTIRVSFPAGSAARTVAVTESSSFGCAGPLASLTIRPDNARVTLELATVQRGDRSITLPLLASETSNNGSQVRILRRNAGSTGAFAVVGSVANTAFSFTDTSVDADATAYDYRLELLNNCGTTLASQEHTTVLLAATATEGSRDGRQEGTVKLAWNAYKGFGVEGYRILRTATSGTDQVVATVSAATLELTLPTGSAGFDQCFRVVALGPADPASGILASSSNEACVNFTNDLVFYNVITPNGDGLNDAFVVRNLGLYSGYSMSFFNRWGKEVYKTTAYDDNWKAEEQPAGVYYYLLKLANGKAYKGWFEVVK
ncbi:gliding motility-associated C-terminal domain-containing protein [Hymenobacter elongatus]|uniref:Gliding motility-associated C-terminal domain-containing protein n=1 Tax=Hymenobacter elongatus TaxID=877208 RepID=A0A4Z0PP06_9BACT|nr:gliding motility-associated C-terminal domain-containing protein [Hymenobacter elongatus]TGE18665.1 gliding motility-associated C-terminal domain-containing protein [Hymenobacter elongatus]